MILPQKRRKKTMIWSIIPESVIFNAEAKEGELRQLVYKGRQVMIRSYPNGKNEIFALLSTDPADFLTPSFYPGALIDNR